MSSGETFNHKHFNFKKKPKSTGSKVESGFQPKSDSINEDLGDLAEKKKNTRGKQAITIGLIGAGALTALSGGIAAWGFGQNEKAKAEAEAKLTETATTQTESAQTNESSVVNANDDTEHAEYMEKYGEYVEWKAFNYQSDIDKLETSTIDIMSKEKIIIPGEIPQADIDKMGSFYMDDIVDSSILYNHVKNIGGAGRLLSLSGYKESQEPLDSQVDDEIKGQAMLDAIFEAKIAAYVVQGKEALVILNYTHITKSIEGGRVLASSVYMTAVDQIRSADEDFEQTGAATVFKNPQDSDAPKFLEFVETIPAMTDFEGNSYHDGKIIKYLINDQIHYALMTWPDVQRFDYKGDKINLPKAVTYSTSLEKLKTDAQSLVIF